MNKKITCVVFLLWATMVAAAPPPPQTVTKADSLALVQLYTSTQGAATWTVKTNWLTGNVDTWYGIVVAGFRVKEINLQNNHLVGPFSNLSSLTTLTRLNLSLNQIFGAIPATINSLTALEYLNLSSNQLNGTIPTLSGLTNLKYLSLSSNIFLSTQSFPPSILSLVNLENLLLSNCRMGNLFPTGLSALTKLKEFDISSNTSLLISNGLAELGQILTLETIRLGSPLLNGTLPSSIAALPALTVLNLDNAGFDALPQPSAWVNRANLNLNITNNNLDFGDLEPYAGTAFQVFTNTAQKGFLLMFNSTSTKLFEGDPLLFKTDPGGTQNQYKWFFNNVQINGATTKILDHGLMAPGKEGSYRLDVTNTLFPGLTISSANFPIGLMPKAETRFTLVGGTILTDAPATTYGSAWGDIDADGDEDLFANNAFAAGPNFLYENLGNGTFQKVTSGDIVTIQDGNRYVSWGDYNNDGYPDIFTGDYTNTLPGSDNTSSLYTNTGNKTFTRTVFNHQADGSLWADQNKDGYLDLLVNVTTGGTSSVMLYQNNKNGTFALQNNFFPISATWFTAWVDIDNDDDLDYMTIPFPEPATSIKIFRNNPSGFAEESLSLPAGTLTVRGGSWGDIDGDGDMDLLILNNSVGAGFLDSQFFINNGTGNFTREDATARLGVKGFGGRGSVFGDADNDGDLDLFLIHTPATGNDIITQLFLNGGSGTFTAVPTTEQSFGYGDTFVGLSLADYDNNGALDLFIGSWDQVHPNYLFKNIQNSNGNHWLKLKLVGTQSNKMAIGARVVFTIGNKTVVRQILPSSGFAGQSSYIVHTGLGAATTANAEIHWPNGLVQTVNNIPGDQQLTITEGVTPQAVPLVTPTTHSSNVAFTNVTQTSMHVTFTAGNGAKRLAVMKAGSAPAFQPANNTTYAGDLGGGQSVAFNGDGHEFDLTALQPSTQYFVTIFEYNQAGTQTKYLVTGAPVADKTTLSTVTALNEEAESFNVKIFANPFKEKLEVFVETPVNEEIALVLTDLSGRKVHQSHERSNTLIEIKKQMSMGLYILHVQTAIASKAIRVGKVD